MENYFCIIGSNLIWRGNAEGSSRKGTKEFIQFLWISNGSLSELETQLEISQRLNYIKNFDEITEKIKHIRKMLLGLIHSLERKL